MKPLILALAALCAGVSAPALAQTIAITHARLVTGDGAAPVDGGTVVLRDGRVVAAGRGVAVPAGATVTDAQGRWVTPGLVAALTDLGINGVAGVDQANDTAARTAVFSAALDVAPAVDPNSVPIGVARMGGVTRAIITPSAGNAIFAGQGAVIDLATDMDAVTRPRAFQYVELGEAGARLSGGSRPASFAAFREALFQARDHARNPSAFGGNDRDAILNRADADALAPVIAGRQPLVVHVERASDILAVLALKKDLPALRLVLAGVAEGWMVAREIAAARVPVIATPMLDLPERFEQLGATQSNIGRMAQAGVLVAVSSNDPTAPTNDSRLAQFGGNLVALTRMPGMTGLEWGAAFAALSTRPAEAIGMGGEIGVLKPGAHGDVVVWDGDPLELASAPVAMWIDGVAQPLASRQTRLRDRYRDLAPQALPEAYRR